MNRRYHRTVTFFIVLCICIVGHGCGPEKYQATASLKPTTPLLNNVPPPDIRSFVASEEQDTYIKARIDEFSTIMRDTSAQGLRNSTVFYSWKTGLLSISASAEDRNEAATYCNVVADEYLRLHPTEMEFIERAK